MAFRKHTLLPFDDCLYALQATIPELTRSSLHRCRQRHDISRLPEVEGDKPKSKKLSAIRSDTFTSVSPRCAPPKAISISLWSSTALPSSLSFNWWNARA